MSPEAYEELRVAAAEAVVFLRGTSQCHVHQHIDVAIMTHDGPCVHHGPVCEVAPEILPEPCPIVAARDEVVERLTDALGTRDMSNFI